MDRCCPAKNEKTLLLHLTTNHPYPFQLGSRRRFEGVGGKSNFLRQKYPRNPSKFNAQDLQLAVNEANNGGPVDNR